MKEYKTEDGTVMEYYAGPDSACVKPKAEHDAVNHPSHYTTGKIEVIDFIEDQKLPMHLGNAVKYICRAGRKDPAKTKEDLEKAIWYMRRYVDHVLTAEP